MANNPDIDTADKNAFMFKGYTLGQIMRACLLTQAHHPPGLSLTTSSPPAEPNPDYYYSSDTRTYEGPLWFGGVASPVCRPITDRERWLMLQDLAVQLFLINPDGEVGFPQLYNGSIWQRRVYKSLGEFLACHKEDKFYRGG